MAILSEAGNLRERGRKREREKERERKRERERKIEIEIDPLICDRYDRPSPTGGSTFIYILCIIFAL